MFQLLTKRLKKKKKHSIEFCEKNLDRFLTKEDFSAYETFLNDNKITYKEYHCQSYCERCKDVAYAIVNGEMVEAESANQLLEKIKKSIDHD